MCGIATLTTLMSMIDMKVPVMTARPTSHLVAPWATPLWGAGTATANGAAL